MRNFINNVMLIVNTLSFLLLIPMGLYWLATRRSPDPLESLLFAAVSASFVLLANWAFSKPEPFGFKKAVLSTLYIVFLAALLMCIILPPKPTGGPPPPPPHTPVKSDGETVPISSVKQRYNIHYDAQAKSITITVYKENNTVNSKQTIVEANSAERLGKLAEALSQADNKEYTYLISITGFPTEQFSADVEKTVNDTFGKARCEINVQKIY